MRVYIVVTHVPFESDRIESVWFIERKAKEEAERINGERTFGQDDIETDVETWDLR